MDRLALAGLCLATIGTAGLLSVELIATAHAGRSSDKTYLVAVSNGSALRLLVQPRDAGRVASVPFGRPGPHEQQLSCERVVGVADLSLGYRCRAAVD